MCLHAMAMVKWKIFRPSGGGGVAVYDYGSDQKRLVDIVGKKGTLWLVTSRGHVKERRSYHLAYKLSECYQVPRENSIFSGKWKYVVRAGNRDNSTHFAYNDITDSIQRFQFTSGKPMSEAQNVGLRLLTIPELRASDIDLVERIEHKLLLGRTVFLSYSHRNRVIISRLESELEKRDVRAKRDTTLLLSGDKFEEALAKEVKSTDCFIVVISPASAKSEWVHREVNWALSELRLGGLVKRIIPLVIAGGGWNSFPQLHQFHRIDMPASAGAEFFNRMANDIAGKQATVGFTGG